MPPAPGSIAGLLGEVAQVGDDVVAGLALELGDPGEVELRRRRLEGGDLLGADRQPELAPGTRRAGSRSGARSRSGGELEKIAAISRDA